MLGAVLHQAVEHFGPTERPFAALEGGLDGTVDESVSFPAPGLVQRVLKAIRYGCWLLPKHVSVDDACDSLAYRVREPVSEAADDRLVTGQ